MDFIIALPKVVGNFDSIFVIVSKLTKVDLLKPTHTTTSTSNIGQLFVKEIVRLHGVPTRIISDSNAKFTSKFWIVMFQSLGTLLNQISTYHLKIDG